MRRLAVSFPLTFSLLPAAHYFGAGRAVFCTVTRGNEQRAADGTAFAVFPVVNGGFQFLIQRQDGGMKPFAQQRVGNALDTDAFFAVIQSNTVAVVVIAALMNQPPHPSILAVIHDGDGTMRLHQIASHCNM
jgi:hypothetical protein